MADPVGHFDNDFEQLEHKEAEDIISSTSDINELQGRADSREAPKSREPEPLINFGDEPTAAAPDEKRQPSVTPAPATVVPPIVEAGAKMCHYCCSFENMDPQVKELLLWRDVKKTGAVFVSSLSILLSLAMFSIISIVAYSALIALTITVTFRLYKTIMGAVQKSSESHPFKNYLDLDLTLTEDSVHRHADLVVNHTQTLVTCLRHYILIEDMIDSLKFALFLWVLTYIGGWFNGMTLIILADICLFSMPKVYEMQKEQIDKHVGTACSKISDACNMVQEKAPFLFKKKQA